MHSDFLSCWEKLRQNESEAQNGFLFVVKQIVKRWSEKTKTEIDWCGNKGKIFCFEELCECILNEVMKSAENGFYRDFNSFRSAVILESQKFTANAFREFQSLMFQKNERAWNRFESVLHTRCLPWFYRRRIVRKEQITGMFNDAVLVFFEKFSAGTLAFNDPPSMKSYFFRILENKFLEWRRSHSHFVDLTEIQECYDAKTEPEMALITEEKNRMLEEALGRLSVTDRDIITSYYYMGEPLNKIARRSNMTEENVRIRKHRAMMQLFKILKEDGYGTFLCSY